MKYLALDYGTKKIGLAVGGPGGLAFPREVVAVTTREKTLARLAGMAEAEGVGALVVGLPLALDGSETLTTRQAKNFGNKLAARTGLAVFFVDERLSTAEADERLKQAGLGGHARKKARDAQAAAVILETFLSREGA